jgi:hypothetical protein
MLLTVPYPRFNLCKGLLVPLPKQCSPLNPLKGVVVLDRVDATLKGHADALHCFGAYYFGVLSAQSLGLSKVDRTGKFFIPLE